MSKILTPLVNFGAGLLTTRTARHLSTPGQATAQQEALLHELILGMAGTIYGQNLGIHDRMTNAAFRENIPLRTHEDFHSYVARMKGGDPHVLWPGHCRYFARSSGVTTGTPRDIPVTDAMLAHFQQAGMDILLYYTSRMGHTGIFLGRQVFLGSPATLEAVPNPNGVDIHSGTLPGIAMKNAPGWFLKSLHEPGQEVARIPDTAERIEATVKRTLDRDITLLAGAPRMLLAFAQILIAHAVEAGRPVKTVRDIWPNLECVVHGGEPLQMFEKRLRTLLGDGVEFHEVFSGPEGIFAVQDARAEMGLRLMTDVGIFYEFLPLSEYNPSRLPLLGRRAVPLSQVTMEVDYALVITTPAGFCRLVTGDIVRFQSLSPHRIVHVGSTELCLNTFNEQVPERSATDSILEVCGRHGWVISDFHVAPQITDRSAVPPRGRHEWWMELDPGCRKTPMSTVLSSELDNAMMQRSPGYTARRGGISIEAPVVRLVTPGTFDRCMNSSGHWSLIKRLPRCRSDRMIADALEALERFEDG